MDHGHAQRPTSGASAAELVAQLREARHRTRRLTEDLSSAELMGPRLDIVNPVLWEIGHIGWFHEYWTLRHAHGRAPLIERSDRLWDSSAVAHATRWQLDLPDRAGTFSYLADVLARQEDLLGGTIDEGVRYFYELAIRHEDMHVEALAYSRQTLSYAQPIGLGAAGRAPAGSLPGDVAVPGGAWRLGSIAADGFVFDNEKWAHETMLAPFRIARAPVTNAQFAAFVDLTIQQQTARDALWTNVSAESLATVDDPIAASIVIERWAALRASGQRLRRHAVPSPDPALTERVRDRNVAPAHQTRSLQRHPHSLDEPPRSRLEIAVLLRHHLPERDDFRVEHAISAPHGVQLRE